jgi:hypothetical protein
MLLEIQDAIVPTVTGRGLVPQTIDGRSAPISSSPPAGCLNLPRRGDAIFRARFSARERLLPWNDRLT